MGVPAFYRWLSEKYPKCIQDVLEERVATAEKQPYLDWRGPHPNHRLYAADVECDNLYIDMNGIIHPAAHPEHGPQPRTEQQMYSNVAATVDRLCRALRPRRLLYLAIDGVAPRAKMNQQRSRRFRSAQEARELAELEAAVRVEILDQKDDDAEGGGASSSSPSPPAAPSTAWDSNVITPGTTFMQGLAMYMRFYIRQRLSTDPSWKHLVVLFSDASIPGEGEHKIMQHVRLQRAQPGYNANLVHVLHGLDADLIMLALATHEAHFYISRDEVLFGRKSIETQEQRQQETGYTEAQRLLDEAVGDRAMQLPINQQKPLQRVSIPILREYLAAEFAPTLQQLGTSGTVSLERLIDDFVFLCFFVGNDFLPHLPSLDIRDGALDFLLNTYQRLMVQPPLRGQYLTQPGGNLNLPAINIILREVGAIEDYVFQLKHENEQRREAEKQRHKQQQQQQRHRHNIPPADGSITVDPQYQRQGKAARILGKQQQSQQQQQQQPSNNKIKKQVTVKATTIKPSKAMAETENLQAAQALKERLLGGSSSSSSSTTKKTTPKEEEEEEETSTKQEEDMEEDEEPAEETHVEGTTQTPTSGSKRKAGTKDGVGQVGDIEEEFDADEGDDNDDDDDEDAPPEPEIPIPVADPAIAKAFKEKVKARQNKKLDEYAKNVVDNVRLHEAGWKDRYYSDKCKADDVAEHGGKEHLFRTYVMGLVWVMKYYYDGCPSWQFYFPFHYAPFASDLQNIERFAKDVKSFQLGKPFNPVEQLMAVLPSDSAHAIPKAARWLMTDPESPIIDFYPKDVPVDPNGKAMPWLWVVLLPFIDEDRLLPALSSTIPKWAKEELLCNMRGLDDAYLYVHSSHPLRPKLATILKPGRTAKDPKVKLSDAAAYGCGGFSGSLRPPLSNELYPVEDEDVKIPPPPDSDKIDDPLPDNLFLEDIDPNLAICVSFTEPIKLPHKSILLPGAKPPKPVLSEDDKRIRRPRINRGASIANMGVSNGKSYQSGYGSMNISSYERALADRQGRGHQMNQAGTRTWGSLEPTFKRPRVNDNPFQQQPGQRQGPPDNAHPQSGNLANIAGHPQQYGQRPPYHHQPTAYQHQQQQRSPYQQPPPYQQQQQHPRQYQQMNSQQPYQRQHANGNMYPGRAPPPPGQRPPYQQHRGPAQHGGRGGPPQQQQQGFSFRQQAPAPGAPQRSRTNADTMRSLREQLSSTLQHNKRQQG
eukprot:scaffold1112_cov92-Amphora_coffeaeformis.AAC.1